MNWAKVTSASQGQSVAVNVPSRVRFLEELRSMIANGKGFTVATLNLDHVVKLRSNASFRSAYAKHSHITADGNPIVWLSRLSGVDVELIPGSELIEPVAKIAAEQGATVALFGSTIEALEPAAEALQSRFPGLEIAAVLSPPMGFDPSSADALGAIEDLKSSGARIVFLALGAPKQEEFAIHAASQMPSTGFFSIGAGLDFISGAQTRAPRWVRRLALEWLWRLLSSPIRLGRRYFACIVILPRLFVEALRSRKGSAAT